MKRREFITLLGGAAATWPMAARAQQPAMPVIGFLSGVSPAPLARRLAALRQGLSESGYVEGRNVAIEYRWGNDQYDRVPALVAELVNRQVAVIITHTDAATFAAKAATTTIPIVFVSGGDPVRTGLVASLARPGGNVTGVTFFAVDLVPKRLEILHKLVPDATVIGLLVDQNQPDAVSQAAEVQEAARTLNVQFVIRNIRTAADIDSAFMAFAQRRIGALVVGAGASFVSHRDQLVALAARDKVPAVYQDREFALNGGLMSYGAGISDIYRQAGVYAGRVLKGEKPSDLPAMQPTKFEFVINLKTANALGLTIPAGVLAIADEVIE
jgi:putative ABC transport system substrate-binding protein